jgi:hypothetical protein
MIFLRIEKMKVQAMTPPNLGMSVVFLIDDLLADIGCKHLAGPV